MASAFLAKYNPATRISNLRQQICSIRQEEDERFHSYWERFNNLVARCPQHQIPDNLLLTHFYEGLLEQQRNLVDASSNGTIFNKNPDEIRTLFNTMATNSQNFGAKASERKTSIKSVNEVSNAHLESKLLDLSNLVSQQIMASGQSLLVCGVCAMTGHVTDQCPLIVGGQENVSAMGGYQGQPKPPGFQQPYNPNWKNNYPPKPYQQNASSSNPQYQYPKQYHPQILPQNNQTSYTPS